MQSCCWISYPSHLRLNGSTTTLLLLRDPKGQTFSSEVIRRSRVFLYLQCIHLCWNHLKSLRYHQVHHLLLRLNRLKIGRFDFRFQPLLPFFPECICIA